MLYIYIYIGVSFCMYSPNFRVHLVLKVPSITRRIQIVQVLLVLRLLSPGSNVLGCRPVLVLESKVPKMAVDPPKGLYIIWIHQKCTCVYIYIYTGFKYLSCPGIRDAASFLQESELELLTQISIVVSHRQNMVVPKLPSAASAHSTPKRGLRIFVGSPV